MIHTCYTFRPLAGILTAVLALSLWFGTASAQLPKVYTMPDTPCDSSYCGTIEYVNGTLFPQAITGMRLRDSLVYAISPLPAYPLTVQAGDSVGLPICFRPGRRGILVDSLTVTILIGATVDTQYVRITGRGIGPEISAAPPVLNFPQTAVGGSAVMVVTLTNSGELPYALTAAMLNIAAPFQVLTPIPASIPPGGSVNIRISFNPTVNGIFTATINLTTVCGGSQDIVANGATALIGTGAVIRISKTLFNPPNNEQSPCTDSRCSDVTIQNVGNAPLIIDSIRWSGSGNEYTITPPVALPIIIAPNSQASLTVCLTTKQRGKRVDTLLVVSNSRNSIAFGLVIDQSGSMKDPIQCGATSTTKMNQAIIQAQSFIDKTLLYIPTVGVQDEIAVSSYTTTNNFSTTPLITTLYNLTPVTDPVRIAVKAAVAGLTPRSGTPTGAALLRMIDTVAKSPLTQRVIVLLTDGDATDATSITVQQIVAAANARGIRIFTVGIGMTATGRTYLQNIAAGTKALSFDAGDCGSLQTAFETITDALSKGTITTDGFAIRITSPELATQSIQFDSLQFGDTACKSLTLTNTGEGDAILDAITLRDLFGNLSSDFVIKAGVVLPIIIPEGGQATIPFCFTPTTLRRRDATATLHYNNCDSVPLAPLFSGAAYATANLRITDQRIGVPAGKVRMPIYCDTSLSLYAVDTITYQVRWNKTMLDLSSVTPAANTQLVGTPTMTFDSRYATASVTIVGKNIPGNGQIGDLEFTVLRGDTLATLVEVVAGKFEDGNPRAKLTNAGLIAYDSMCFRSSKGVSAGIAAKVVVGEITPNPNTSGTVTVPVNAEFETRISTEMYTENGSRVAAPLSHLLQAGDNGVPLNVSGLPSGCYYVAIHTERGDVQFRKIVRVR